jgi:two-component sensor histidine kinase
VPYPGSLTGARSVRRGSSKAESRSARDGRAGRAGTPLGTGSLLLLAELSHRVKNTPAVVQALAERAGEGATPVVEFRSAFAGRLRALATAHSLLTADSWRGASLVELAEAALAPYLGREDGVRLEVQDLALRPHVAQTFALAFHELATNAGKHGALSTAVGRSRDAVAE